MLKFKDIVLRLKNLFKMQNVYDCVRPILFVMSLFGVGATKTVKVDGVNSLQNTRYSIVMTLVTSLYTPWFVLRHLMYLFNGRRRSILRSVANIEMFFVQFLIMVTVTIGCIMTRVCCKDLDKAFKIIENIDVKLKQENIKMKHWKTTLAATVLGLLTVDYVEIANDVNSIVGRRFRFFAVFMSILNLIYTILYHVYYVWVILFLLIIYERFVSINKLYLQNARVINIRIVGCRNLRGDHSLRYISMARHLDIQLSEAIVLYSNVFRYTIAGLLLHPIVRTLFCALYIYYGQFEDWILLAYINIFTQCTRILIIIYICQAYKEERRVLSARLRHMISHETDRRIIQQVQQYILYNATSVTGLIDFQFTGVDNVLLFTIIDLIISNVLIIYSYAR